MTVFSKTITRMGLGLAGVALAVSACGGGETDDEVRAMLIEELTVRADVSEQDATCIIDQALEDHSLAELSELNGDSPSAEVQDSVARTTLSCLLDSGGLEDLLDNEGDTEEAADESVEGQTAETVAPTPVAISGQQAFCDTSADYYTAFHAVDLFDESNPGQYRAGFELMQLHLDLAVTLAPTPELAEAPTVAKEHFDVIHGELRSFDYDWNRFEASDRYAPVVDRLAVLDQIDSLLAEYLLGPCQLDRATLDERSTSLAEEITASTGTGTATSPSGVPDGYTAVFDPSDRLRVHVPQEWADIKSWSTATSSLMIVAPDAGEYETSWAADGLQMVVTDAGPDFDWRQPMFTTAAAEECSLVDSRPYDDGLYTGWIDTYEACGSTTDAVVIGATDAEHSIEILIEIQFDTEGTAQDAETLNVIIESFMAR